MLPPECKRSPQSFTRAGDRRSISIRSASRSHGHFAGDDATRTQAFLEVANDETYDAVWCARGGYGSCRVAEAVIRGLTEAARHKAYVGYSDAGTLLAGLYRAGFACRSARPDAG